MIGFLIGSAIFAAGTFIAGLIRCAVWAYVNRVDWGARW